MKISNRFEKEIGDDMKIALIQQHASNETAANIQKGLNNLDKAAEQGAELAVFAELRVGRLAPFLKYVGQAGDRDYLVFDCLD